LKLLFRHFSLLSSEKKYFINLSMKGESHQERGNNMSPEKCDTLPHLTGVFPSLVADVVEARL
jgi:hypothetical protein